MPPQDYTAIFGRLPPVSRLPSLGTACTAKPGHQSPNPLHPNSVPHDPSTVPGTIISVETDTCSRRKVSDNRPILSPRRQTAFPNTTLSNSKCRGEESVFVYQRFRLKRYYKMDQHIRCHAWLCRRACKKKYATTTASRAPTGPTGDPCLPTSHLPYSSSN